MAKEQMKNISPIVIQAANQMMLDGAVMAYAAGRVEEAADHCRAVLTCFPDNQIANQLLNHYLSDQEGRETEHLDTETKQALDSRLKSWSLELGLDMLRGSPAAVVDREAMGALVRKRRVLITGAGGTIGGELVRQISDFSPASIAMLDHGEKMLDRIDEELADRHPELERRAILGDVRDRVQIEHVIANIRPELVFHTAALKHVPMIEDNPMEGVLTNTIGSRVVADACHAGGVSLMVQISTDKAVKSSSVMGATRRLAESYCQALDLAERSRDGTRYVTVRVGDVLGSAGSIVPLLQRQLARGGPLTITHPEMKRHFVTAREAVELVLQASVIGYRNPEARGKIFALDKGEPVRILDLARQMIRITGMRPNEDVKIEFIGLRPGEKLYEELLYSDEERMESPWPGLILAAPRTTDLEVLSRALDELQQAAQARYRPQTLALIHRLVPEYRDQEERPSAVSL